MNNERLSHTDTAVWTGIISDFAVAIGKGAAGYFSGSRALMGDALHSAANAATLLADRLPWFGGRKLSKGNGMRSSGQQAEPFISILFSVIILMSGLQIAVSALKDLSSGTPEAPGRLALIAVLVSLAVNQAVFQYQYRQSKKNNDRRFEVHSENYRFGLYSSLTVLISVFLTMAGAYFEMQALLYMDSIAALIVSGLVLRKGYILIVRSVYGTLPEEPRHEKCADYLDTIQRVHGVITIEDLKVQEHGQVRQISLDVKVSVNPRITVWEAHEIADRIRKLLLHRFIHVTEANVSVVPYEPGYPYKSNYDLMDNDLPTLPQ
ncbi:cation diffusion facilitator family transporter [Paenibacillus sp. N3/727]|uniref:cation diffusion facilitator family transporter n=1 Tax=Paenibacillus sp. N3/727 TaxID=2925845 RepID=UPI001F52B96F|nr:cation diffusion facilitator family transporter [Paenibacillus sp. N3/727]UNK19877.1 cation diffusion facilitator family transporter [Paenibacillus sp. N3/727]